jgi:hypothetical protein
MVERGQLQALSLLLPGKEARYPLDRKLGEAKSRPERFKSEKNLLRLLGIESRIFGRHLVA